MKYPQHVFVLKEEIYFSDIFFIWSYATLLANTSDDKFTIFFLFCLSRYNNRYIKKWVRDQNKGHSDYFWHRIHCF